MKIQKPQLASSLQPGQVAYFSTLRIQNVQTFYFSERDRHAARLVQRAFNGRTQSGVGDVDCRDRDLFTKALRKGYKVREADLPVAIQIVLCVISFIALTETELRRELYEIAEADGSVPVEVGKRRVGAIGIRGDCRGCCARNGPWWNRPRRIWRNRSGRRQ